MKSKTLALLLALALITPNVSLAQERGFVSSFFCEVFSVFTGSDCDAPAAPETPVDTAPEAVRSVVAEVSPDVSDGSQAPAAPTSSGVSLPTLARADVQLMIDRAISGLSVLEPIPNLVPQQVIVYRSSSAQNDSLANSSARALASLRTDIEEGRVSVPLSAVTGQSETLSGDADLSGLSFANATGTNATTTSLFSTVGEFVTGVIGTLTSTIANIGSLFADNLTATNATSTNLVSLTAPVAPSFVATSTTATSTFAGNVSVGGVLALSQGLSVASGGTGGTDALSARANLGLAYASSVEVEGALVSQNIAAWGDSLTSASHFQARLSSLIGRNIYNGGVGGENSTQIKSRMLADTDRYDNSVIIWAGRNNFASKATVLADIAAMVAALGHDRYVIVSVLNGAGEGNPSTAYAQITDLNNTLAATYPGRFADVRTMLVSNYNASIPQDVTDHAADTVPSSLRTDSIHLQIEAYYLVGDYLYANFNDVLVPESSNTDPRVLSLNTALGLFGSKKIDSGNIAFGGSDGVLTQRSSFKYDELTNRLGLGNDGLASSTHQLTLGASNGIALYNTTDWSTNFERLVIDRLNNQFNIKSQSGGTGTLRDINITLAAGAPTSISLVSGGGAAGYIKMGRNVSGGGGLMVGVGSGNSLLGSSGLSRGLGIIPTVNQSGSAGYQGLYISPYEQATGTGQKYLIDAGINSAAANAGTHTSRFVLTNDGNVGIGTTTPAQKLTVGGASHLAGNVGINTAPASSALTVYGQVDLGLNSTNLLRFSNDTVSNVLQSYVSGAVGRLVLNRDGGRVIVGGGTATAKANFQIAQSVSGNFTVGNTIVQHGVEENSRLTGTGSSNAYAGYTASTQILDSANWDHYAGFQTDMSLVGSPNITDVRAFSSNLNFNGGGSPVIGSAYGMYVLNPTMGSATVTNNYGLYVANLSGATNNYSIYTGTAKSYFGGNVGIGTTSPTAQLTNTGTVRFGALGSAGASLVTDSVGNVTVSSDERLKDVVSPFSRGLSDVLGLEPITYRWNAISGLETDGLYSGFSAQDVRDSIPEAVGTDSRGYLTLSDRPILAAVVNAVRELSAKVDALMSSHFTYINEASIGVLNAGKINIQGDVCVDGVCVTKEQFKNIFMQNGATVYGTGEYQAPTPTSPAPTPDPDPVASSTPVEIIDETASSTTPVDIPEETASTTPDVIVEEPVEEAPVQEEVLVSEETEEVEEPEETSVVAP